MLIIESQTLFPQNIVTDADYIILFIAVDSDR